MNWQKNCKIDFKCDKLSPKRYTKNMTTTIDLASHCVVMVNRVWCKFVRVRLVYLIYMHIHIYNHSYIYIEAQAITHRHSCACTHTHTHTRINTHIYRLPLKYIILAWLALIYPKAWLTYLSKDFSIKWHPAIGSNSIYDKCIGVNAMNCTVTQWRITKIIINA